MEPSQMRKEVESLIRTLGGPNDPMLVTRHPKAYKRGTVLIKPPVTDCLQRAVERVEGKILAAAEAQQKEKDREEEEIQRKLQLAQARLGMNANFDVDNNNQQNNNNNNNTNNEIKGSSLHPDLLNAMSPSRQQQNRSHSAGRNNNNHHHSENSRGRATPSPCRGAVMSFRTNARLFIGKDFPCGSVDSPGPIYEQKGFGINTTNGVSFSKARRETPDAASNNAGPAYNGIPGIGKQFLSERENPINVVFSKAGRFGEVKENERMKNRGKGPYQVPGPGAYLSDLDHLPHHRGMAYSPAPSLGNRHSGNTFISKAHFTENQGRCSPGPMYNVSGMERGIFPPSHTPTFGKGERIPLNRRDKVPGPGTYSPDDGETVIQGPTIKFARSRRMSSNTTDSPGPIYTPSYEFAEKGQHVVRIGYGPDEDGGRERFNTKLHLGNKLGVDAVGRDSPGPMYNPQRKWEGPAYTMQFKEKKVRQSVFPRPERARWISEQTAKENLGAWSPGPAYDTRGDISREGIAYSFTGANTNRASSNNNNNSNDKSKNGSSVVGANIMSTTNNNNTPSNGSTNKSKDLHGNNGENTVPYYNTDISMLSTSKPILCSVKMCKPAEVKSPGRGGDQKSGHHNNSSSSSSAVYPPLYNPKDEICHAAAPSFSFGKGDRSSSIWQTHQDKQQVKGSSSAVTGSGMLNINYSQVEQGCHGPRLGGLSLPG